MIMPEQIVRQLELLKIVMAWDPDELHLRTEMEVASGIESFGRSFFDSSPGVGWLERIGQHG